jgi:preprotein translocase subunit SecE
MNANVQMNPKYDYFIWTVIVLLVAAGISANYYFATQPIAIRLIGWLVLACATAFIALQTRSGQLVWQFMRESRIEMRKVTWPTRQETIQTTMVVVGMVVIVSLILWGLDSFLLWAIAILTGQRG